MKSIVVFLLLFGFVRPDNLEHHLHIFIVTQHADKHVSSAETFRDLVKSESAKLTGEKKIQVTISTEEFLNAYGPSAVWPILIDLEQQSIEQFKSDSYWLMIVEDQTTLKLQRLITLLNSQSNPGAHDVFLGHALADIDRSVIHHYEPGLHEVERNVEKHKYLQYESGATDGILRYPDFGAGVILSSQLVSKLTTHLRTKVEKASDFMIDPKYEFAKFVLDSTGTRLTHSNQLCLTPSEKTRNQCATELTITANFGTACAAANLTNSQLMFAVKTCQKYHNDRIPVVKRTWAMNTEQIVFYSDVEDLFIPTITLFGISNTERGHCAKTLGIMRRSIDINEWIDAKWLVVTDDDTLLSVERLIALLKCYDPSTPVIIGEKYGYGYSIDGSNGYDYPTGGASMIFSLPAISILLEHCRCPKPDSPDDMILGMCARDRNVPIIHSRQLHQARPHEYSRAYIDSAPPISFHKHTDIDPFAVYREYLAPAHWRLVDVPIHQTPYKIRVDERKESKTNADSYREMLEEGDEAKYRTAHKQAKHGEEL